MRHDPASGAIIIMLRSLKMHGMAQAGHSRKAQAAVSQLRGRPWLANSRSTPRLRNRELTGT